MEPSRIQAVDHVNLEAALGLEEPLRWFYGEVAELVECDHSGAPGADLCFKSERIELRIRLSGAPKIDPVPCRVTIAVPRLEDTAERLTERRVDFVRLTGALYSDRRLETSDPGGNRVVLKQHHPFGPV